MEWLVLCIPHTNHILQIEEVYRSCVDFDIKKINPFWIRQLQVHIQGGNSLLQSRPDIMDNSDMIGLWANELNLQMIQKCSVMHLLAWESNRTELLIRWTGKDIEYSLIFHLNKKGCQWISEHNVSLKPCQLCRIIKYFSANPLSPFIDIESQALAHSLGWP